MIERHTWFGGRIVVDKDTQDNYSLAVEKEESTNFLDTAIKIATMVLTLGLSVLVALAIKALTRPNMMIFTPEEFASIKFDPAIGINLSKIPHSTYIRYFKSLTEDQQVGLYAGELKFGGANGFTLIANNKPIDPTHSLLNCRFNFATEAIVTPQRIREMRAQGESVVRELADLKRAQKAIPLLQLVSMDDICCHFANCYNETYELNNIPNRPPHLEATEEAVLSRYSAITTPPTDLLSLKNDRIALVRALNKLEIINDKQVREKLQAAANINPHN